MSTHINWEHAHTHALDTLCQYEFDDGGLCGHDALLDAARCAGHHDDDQLDYLPDPVSGGVVQ